MEIHRADYLASYDRLEQCPPPERPEYAFIGRSNVGKSSLINMLCKQNQLARVSKQPGKTQAINYFDVDDTWYLVDLPGYGYAKRSKKMREAWRRMVRYYLKHRENLQCAFLLIDANVAPQKVDLEFINWMGQAAVPFVLVYTKTDRLKPHQLGDNIQAFQNTMLEQWTQMPQEFITSAQAETGRDEILQFIGQVNTQFEIL